MLQIHILNIPFLKCFFTRNIIKVQGLLFCFVFSCFRLCQVNISNPKIWNSLKPKPLSLETESHIAQDGLKLNSIAEDILNSWSSSCLSVPVARITGLFHQAHFHVILWVWLGGLLGSTLPIEEYLGHKNFWNTLSKFWILKHLDTGFSVHIDSDIWKGSGIWFLRW